MKVSGSAIKLGSNIDTDVILPGKYLVLISPNDLAKHAMEGLDPSFAKKAAKGIVLVAGRNFGCGSSREQAPLALKYAGVKCIVAESFARIFFRNAINIGLPVIECRGISATVDSGDEVVIDFDSGEIQNKSSGKTISGVKLPSFIQEILADGGLIENLQRRLKKK
jgi:3-isopropylmalate/(R)-2-methylmalate dehydratase small subunit